MSEKKNSPLIVSSLSSVPWVTQGTQNDDSHGRALESPWEKRNLDAARLDDDMRIACRTRFCSLSVALLLSVAWVPVPFVVAEETLPLPMPEVVISEFLAANRGGRRDEDGRASDWIELHNRGGGVADLGDWSLTDDVEVPAKWTLRPVALEPGQHLVVFASGKNRKSPTGPHLHTNFELSQASEYLGLYTPEPRRRAVAAVRFPEQRIDHSYGLGEDDLWGFMDPPTPGEANGPARGGVAFPPELPHSLSLETKWQALQDRRGPEALMVIDQLLEESSEGDAVLPWARSVHTSYWSQLDRHLLSQDPLSLGELRRAQDRATAVPVITSYDAVGAQVLFRRYRRTPWSSGCHESLVAFGEVSLRRGWIGLAYRAFRDVLDHSSTPALRSRAQVGLWLSLFGETQNRVAIDRAFDGVDPDEPFPWMGAQIPARSIRERWLESRAEEGGRTPPPALSELRRRLVKIPPTAPWPFSSVPRGVAHSRSPVDHLQVEGEKILVSGPNLLACFGKDWTRPLWSRTPRDTPRGRRPGRAKQQFHPTPGYFLPSLSGGRLYTRWGFDGANRSLKGVTAFDLATGALLWSTARDPAWEGRVPISDPTLAEGRVYVLTLGEGGSWLWPVSLVCLEAEKGTLLWSRLLGSQDPALPNRQGERRKSPEAIDLVRFGNAVTVRLGSVYCSTNMGFAARCDARDGLIEWIHIYPRARSDRDRAALVQRWGAAPQVVRDQVILVPRDRMGVFSLNVERGSLEWENLEAPSDEVIGLVGGNLILKDSRRVVAVDASTGRLRWQRDVPETRPGRPVLVGSTVYLGSRDRLLRLDAENGDILEESTWNPSDVMDEFVLRAGDILGISWSSLATESHARSLPSSPQTRPKLPLRELWELSRENPWVWRPPAGGALTDKIFLESRSVLECIQLGRETGILWRRFLPPDFSEVRFSRNSVVLVCETRVIALDAAAGVPRWSTPVPFEIDNVALREPFLFVSRGRGARFAGILGLKTGQLLWQRDFGEGKLLEAGWDRGDLHLILDGYSEDRRRRNDLTHLALRPADGGIRRSEVLPLERRGERRRLVCGGGFAFYTSGLDRVEEYSVRSGKLVAPPRTLRDFRARDLRGFRLVGDWLQLHQERRSRGGPVECTQWILRHARTSGWSASRRRFPRQTGASYACL